MNTMKVTMYAMILALFCSLVQVCPRHSRLRRGLLDVDRAGLLLSCQQAV